MNAFPPAFRPGRGAPIRLNGARRLLVAAPVLLLLANTTAHAQDKTPQPPTIGSPVPLSAAQRAAIAAKPTWAPPAPAVMVPAKSGDGFVAPPAGDASSQHGLVPASAAQQEADRAAAYAAGNPAMSRPVRVTAPWRTVSPALGEIPRLEWKFPALAKPAETFWLEGRVYPMTPAGVAQASGGAR